ncbi:MAG TPA: hypothetical protein VGS80_15075 [Ktedonobacterales bacterium]|jgi:hypothetical protein|nr:hypothetical protein [Ktedonobacterales bacterium]
MARKTRELEKARRVESELGILWSPVYRPEWDSTAEAYVEHGVVGWGRSRRLGRAEDVERRFKAYLGVQHDDPARWGLAGEPRARFFVSLFVGQRTVALRTYPTMGEAVETLERFHAAL